MPSYAYTFQYENGRRCSYSSSASDSHSEPESTHTTSTTTSTSSNGSIRSHNLKKVLHKPTNTYVHQLSISSFTIPTPPIHTHPHIQRLLDTKSRPASTRASLYYEYSNFGTLADLIHQTLSRSLKIDESFIWDLFMQLSSALLWLHSGGESGKYGVRRRWDLRVRTPTSHKSKSKPTSTTTTTTPITAESIFLHKLPSGRVVTRLSRPPTSGLAAESADVHALATIIKSLCTLSTTAGPAPLPQIYTPRLAHLLARCLTPIAESRPSVHAVYVATVHAILERKCLANGRSVEDARKVEAWMMNIVDWKSGEKAKKGKNLMEWAVEHKCDEVAEMVAEVVARENEIEEERRRGGEGRRGGMM